MKSKIIKFVVIIGAVLIGIGFSTLRDDHSDIEEVSHQIENEFLSFICSVSTPGVLLFLLFLALLVYLVIVIPRRIKAAKQRKNEKSDNQCLY